MLIGPSSTSKWQTSSTKRMHESEVQTSIPDGLKTGFTDDVISGFKNSSVRFTKFGLLEKNTNLTQPNLQIGSNKGVVNESVRNAETKTCLSNIF